jgi:hypothetical protein
MQWRLLAESLRQLLRRAPGTSAGCGLLDLCSVLFLYCGSCQPAT